MYLQIEREIHLVNLCKKKKTHFPHIASLTLYKANLCMYIHTRVYILQLLLGVTKIDLVFIAN